MHAHRQCGSAQRVPAGLGRMAAGGDRRAAAAEGLKGNTLWVCEHPRRLADSLRRLAHSLNASAHLSHGGLICLGRRCQPLNAVAHLSHGWLIRLSRRSQLGDPAAHVGDPAAHAIGDVGAMPAQQILSAVPMRSGRSGEDIVGVLRRQGE